jgi:hypothetical protein
VDWIHLAQRRVSWQAGFCENGNKLSDPKEVVEFVESLRDC